MPKSVPLVKVRGRAPRWSPEQNAVICAALPEWHRFSLIEHQRLDGKDKVLCNWKKEKAEEIMKDPLFEKLPEGVSLPGYVAYIQLLTGTLDLTKMTPANARLTIVRKFTNYRGGNLRKRVPANNGDAKNNNNFLKGETRSPPTDTPAVDRGNLNLTLSQRKSLALEWFKLQAGTNAENNKLNSEFKQMGISPIEDLVW
jgi:hypothetical protein